MSGISAVDPTTQPSGIGQYLPKEGPVKNSAREIAYEIGHLQRSLQNDTQMFFNGTIVLKSWEITYWYNDKRDCPTGVLWYNKNIDYAISRIRERILSGEVPADSTFGLISMLDGVKAGAVQEAKGVAEVAFIHARVKRLLQQMGEICHYCLNSEEGPFSDRSWALFGRDIGKLLTKVQEALDLAEQKMKRKEIPCSNRTALYLESTYAAIRAMIEQLQDAGLLSHGNVLFLPNFRNLVSEGENVPVVVVLWPKDPKIPKLDLSAVTITSICRKVENILCHVECMRTGYLEPEEDLSPDNEAQYQVTIRKLLMEIYQLLSSASQKIANREILRTPESDRQLEEWHEAVQAMLIQLQEDGLLTKEEAAVALSFKLVLNEEADGHSVAVSSEESCLDENREELYAAANLLSRVHCLQTSPA